MTIINSINVNPLCVFILFILFQHCFFTHIYFYSPLHESKQSYNEITVFDVSGVKLSIATFKFHNS